MVLLIENRVNYVWLKVNSAIDINGFSAALAACGVLQTKTDLTANELRFSFTAAQVAKMSKQGTYGTLVVYDGDGKQYIKYLPQFKLVSEAEAATARNQTIYITIASTKEASGVSDSSGTSPSGGSGVTMQEVNAAISQAVNGITQAAIQEQPVTVVNQEGEQVTMTVQEAVQQVVEMQTQVEQAMETHMVGNVVDENDDGQPDDETIYFNTNKISN